MRYCGRAPHWAQKAAPFLHEEYPSSCRNRVRFLCALVARAGLLQNPQRFLPVMSPPDSRSVSRARTMRQPLDRVRAVSQVMRQGRTSRGSTSPSTCFDGHCRRQPDHEVAQQSSPAWSDVEFTSKRGLRQLGDHARATLAASPCTARPHTRAVRDAVAPPRSAHRACVVGRLFCEPRMRRKARAGVCTSSTHSTHSALVVDARLWAIKALFLTF